MDMNNDMELDNYEIILGNVKEGATVAEPSSITQEMVLKSINSNFKENRIVTRGVSMAIYDGVKDKIEEYAEVKKMGR